MTAYCVGIDTGGTFTDVVLIDNASAQVVHWAKERTTHNDLSIGVGKALASLFKHGVNPAEVSRLSVSTTLATNAVVEGRGARVGLFVLGYVRHFKLPVVASIFLKGGHTITGKEDESLDMERLIDTLPGLRNEVDSYAVCGAMSIKNPAHELVVEEAISMLDPKPVFCSHQVSTHPGMLERSATACLHAKLMPLMVDFLASIQRSMLQVGLSCPVSIICGNGTGTSLENAVERAAITMASGPAATARFGSSSEVNSALVVDVGGTTTDICLVKDGAPLMNEEGCRIGQWQTHVEAVDMYTSGGGGDSHVLCHKDGSLSLDKTRMQPLSMTADLPDPRQWLDTEKNDYIILPVSGIEPEIIAADPILSYLDRKGAVTPEQMAAATNISGITLEKRLERLVFYQQVILTGFTPTDALHVLDSLNIGIKNNACAGAEVLAEKLGISTVPFCRQVIEETERVIETIILNYVGRTIWKDQQATPLLNQRNNDLFSINFSLKLPIIGIGAAARYFLPGVAKRLQTTVSFPQHYEVGNAIGAALIGLEEA